MTNNQQLHQIKQQYQLTYKQLSEAMGCSWYSVKAYLLNPQSEAYRSLSDDKLNLLLKKVKR
jgi:hypothetical protein